MLINKVTCLRYHQSNDAIFEIPVTGWVMIKKMHSACRMSKQQDRKHGLLPILSAVGEQKARLQVQNRGSSGNKPDLIFFKLDQRITLTFGVPDNGR